MKSEGWVVLSPGHSLVREDNLVRKDSLVRKDIPVKRGRTVDFGCTFQQFHPMGNLAVASRNELCRGSRIFTLPKSKLALLELGRFSDRLSVGNLANVITLLLILIAFTGCQDSSLVQDVSQRQANQIVALLSEHGIGAEAERGTSGRAQYRVLVKRSNYTQAIILLEKNDLPKEERQSFAELIEPRGFLPNSREAELLRLDHAVAVEIEEVLKDFPGVRSVKVIVRKESVESENQTSASVTMVAEAGRKIDEGAVREVVKRALPGMDDSKVLIVVQAGPTEKIEAGDLVGVQNEDGRIVRLPLRHFLKLWRIPEEDYPGLSMTLLGCMILMGAVGFLVGHWFSVLQNSRRQSFATGKEIALRPTAAKTAPAERVRKDLTEV